MKKILLLIAFLALSLEQKAQSFETDCPQVSEQFRLCQNYPNPAKDVTVIQLQINTPGHVVLKLYDMLGNAVLTIIDQNMPMGMYSIPLETRNIPDGIYFYILKKGGLEQTMRMVVSKS